MHKEGDEIHVDDVEASGGSKEGVVRWVLIIGLLLAIGLLSVTWITGALIQGDVEEEATVSGEISSTEDEGDSTDSIVGLDADDLDDGDEASSELLETVEN